MNDIIAALATASGESGIAVVRLSGEGSAALAGNILRGKTALADCPARTMRLFSLTDGKTDFDEALAVRFEKGASYTGEESAEIQCHGGLLPARKTLERLCELGARVAEPGEFTKRAFLNGRLDLSQAEAVLGIIKAKSVEALAASERTLQGGFTAKMNEFLKRLTELAAHLEADIDFPEDDSGLLPREEFGGSLRKAVEDCETLRESCRSGLLLREGLKVAILGAPNVGKSSLLNALLKEERAIVTELPGTTRDKIEESIVFGGVPIRLIDTAGIRETNDRIEEIGVKTSLKELEAADLAVWIADGSRELSADDKALAAKVRKKKNIAVISKADLPQRISEMDIKGLGFDAVLKISALKNEGIEELKGTIVKAASTDGGFAGSFGVSARQMDCLSRALEALKNGLKAHEERLGEDLAASSVAEARNHISSLLGLDPTESLLDKVFMEFCVGK